MDETQAVQDVVAERRRQVEIEGWSPDHDDAHAGGELAKAAICYADPTYSLAGVWWPWERHWWKPKTRRQNLVRAAALLVAEIDRLDRIASPPEKKEG